MSTPESRFRAEVLERIRADYPPSRGEVVVFGWPANASTGSGNPDLIGVACGRPVGLELKFGPKSQPTDAQVNRIHRLRRAGAYVWVIRSTLDATRAIYQAKTGGPVPMANDPIDFDDWFKNITAEAAAQEKATVPVGLQGQQINRDPDPLPEEVIGLEEPERPSVDDLQVARDNGLLNADVPERFDSDEGLAPVVDAFQHLVDVVKAVGDRVTEVWETVNRIEHVSRVTFNGYADVAQEVINLHVALDKILTEIGEEPLPEPMAEPTPLDDVLPAEEPAQPRRGRRRKAS